MSTYHHHLPPLGMVVQRRVLGNIFYFVDVLTSFLDVQHIVFYWNDLYILPCIKVVELDRWAWGWADRNDVTRPPFASDVTGRLWRHRLHSLPPLRTMDHEKELHIFFSLIPRIVFKVISNRRCLTKLNEDIRKIWTRPSEPLSNQLPRSRVVVEREHVIFISINS